MFGGPAPIVSPEGNTVGYYDHDAGKAGMQITGVYAGIAPLFMPQGWMDVVGTRASTPIVEALDRGIVEALQGHHAVPKHMGGRVAQELAPLRESYHSELHKMLREAFQQAGLPPVGGRAGSRDVWTARFAENAESYDKALDILG